VTGLLLRDAELEGRTPADIRVSGGRVTQVAATLRPRPDEVAYDCRGGAGTVSIWLHRCPFPFHGTQARPHNAVSG
jgi:hypothetical protein